MPIPVYYTRLDTGALTYHNDARRYWPEAMGVWQCAQKVTTANLFGAGLDGILLGVSEYDGADSARYEWRGNCVYLKRVSL